MSISLPIPEIKIVEKEYYWVPFDTKQKCVKHSFKLKSHEPIKNLRKYIGNSFDLHPESFELSLVNEE